MKLEEYLETNDYFQGDFITLIRMENLYKEFSNDQRFYLHNLWFGVDFSKVSKNFNYILSLNPDLDFPPVKKDFFEFSQGPFDKEKQDYIDNVDYKSKIDIEILNNIPNHITQIFCHANGVSHPKVTMVPIGRDYKNDRYFLEVDKFSKTDKNILCYYNCTLPPPELHYYGFLRKHIYDYCQNKSFVFCEHCTEHPRNYNDEININFFRRLASSKFMICPRGCGIDTYRMWECIHMGCVPIVEKYDGYKQYEDLPILFVDHWKDYDKLTAEYLEEKWNEMLKMEFNYEKLKLSYWRNLFMNLT